MEEQIHSPILHHDSMFESESGQASVYLYKRDGESAGEILQPLISQDPRHFRSVGTLKSTPWRMILGPSSLIWDPLKSTPWKFDQVHAFKSLLDP